MASRKTAEVVRVSDARIAAPSHLTPEQSVEWRGIVDSLPSDFFRPGDVPLLAAYCVASSFYKRAAADIESRGMVLTDARGREYVNPAHNLLTSQAASMAQLAQKLRLCPSARVIGKLAGKMAGGPALPKRPWEFSGSR